MPTALEIATKVYALFGEGKIPEIGELYAESGAVTWMGDKGKEEFGGGFMGFAAGVLSRIPVEWQGFALDWEKREILIDAGPKCLIKLPVKTSNGMDTYFVHYYEVDDAGKILKFMALDDGASLAKYCVGTTAAEPEALATLSKFCAFGDDCAEYATEDCLMNPPGAPPMPVAVMTGMMAGLRASCWPTWKSKFHGATKNADGTYNVLTQQCLGPMAADFPAMGPFPEVKLDSVPEIMKTEDLCNPVEVGKFELTEDKKKVKLCTYTISSHLGHGMPGMASPSVAGVWGAKGDGSDVGFGAYFTLMGVELPPPPAP